MENILQVDKLYKKYPKKVALNNISFSLNSGKIVGLLGPNGSGKTTLIKIINTLITDYTGEITVCNNPLGVQSKKAISYLPDNSYLSKWMTINSCIEMFNDFYADFDKVKAYSLCSDLKLDIRAKVNTLSKGMNEKLQLLLVMSRKSKLYIFDEPIAGVDPAARDFILNTILTNYNEEGTIFLSTHLISDVEQIFDQVLFLKDGEIVLNEMADALRERTGQTLNDHFREIFRN